MLYDKEPSYLFFIVLKKTIFTLNTNERIVDRYIRVEPLSRKALKGIQQAYQTERSMEYSGVST